MDLPEKLIHLISHKNVEIRLKALKDLKENNRDISVFIPLLVNCLEDEDWRVRKTAVRLLLDIRGETVIKELIATLNRKDSANARNSAIEVLIALGFGATSYLIDAFKSSGTDVKKFIIDILGSIKDLKALPLLLRALEDKDENVRASAVEHLGNIQNNVTVVNTLIRVLRKDDTWVAYLAANALGRIGDARAVDALVSVLPQKALRKPAILALGNIADAGSLDSIVPSLNDEARTVREETVKAIEKFYLKGVPEETIVNSIKSISGVESTEILLSYAQSSKEDVKVAAVLLLGLFKDENIIAPLLEMSVEEESREIIIKTLVFIGKSRPESLLPFFGTNNPYQRRVICEVAGKVGDSVYFKPFIRYLKDEDGHVRGNSALALSCLGNPKAIEYIKPLLLDEYENIQYDAVRAISGFKKWLDVDELIIGFSDKNPVLRRNTAQLLGLLKDQKSIRALGLSLKDSDLKTRVYVVQALGNINGPNVLNFLFLALMDESSEVRRIAATAIGKMRTDKGIDPLILLLRDSDAWVRSAAAEGLGTIGNKRAIEPLIQLLSDESGFVRTAVVEAFGNFTDEKVKNTLLQLLNDADPEIRSAAVGSLAVFDGIAQDIIPLLKDKEWAVRKQVVDVLGEFFRDESSAYLKETANIDEDSQVRETAARYLSV